MVECGCAHRSDFSQVTVGFSDEENCLTYVITLHCENVIRLIIARACFPN